MEKKHVFTPMEKKLFTHMLNKYKSIIENRETDGASLRKKNKAWEKLTYEFNSSPTSTSQASSKQLRRLWINIKQRQREALIKERQLRLAAVGSSITDGETDPLIVGISNTTNSDTSQEMKISKDEKKIPIPFGEDVIIEQDDHDYSFMPTTFLHTRSSPPPTRQTISPIPYSTRRQKSSPTFTYNTTPSTRWKNMNKISITEREYKDNLVRANEKHELEKSVLKEQLREARAKADLAELILKQKQDLFSKNLHY